MIELINVTKKFGKKIAVNNLSLHIEKGKLTMLIGPSGCGKTTTMRMINRLTRYNEGDIKLNGVSIDEINPVKLRRSIGYVIQEIGLFPHFTVYDNIATVPRLLKWDEKKIRKRVEELLNIVTLDYNYAYKYPLQLSGGERQRVGLARSLGADPEVLLMDEPFGAIDPINRLKLQDTFLEIQEEIKKIAIIKDGSLVQYDDAAEILANPANKFVENLLGQDRSIKALSLKKTKDFIIKDNLVTVSNEETEREITKKLQKKKVKIAFVLDEYNKLIGRYWLEESKKKEQVEINFDDNPIFTERNNTLKETLSTMLESGEKLLPVVNRKKIFVGIIKLNNIFEEVNK